MKYQVIDGTSQYWPSFFPSTHVRTISFWQLVNCPTALQEIEVFPTYKKALKETTSKNTSYPDVTFHTLGKAPFFDVVIESSEKKITFLTYECRASGIITYLDASCTRWKQSVRSFQTLIIIILDASYMSSGVRGALNAIFGWSRMASEVMGDPDAISDSSRMASGVKGSPDNRNEKEKERDINYTGETKRRETFSRLRRVTLVVYHCTSLFEDFNDELVLGYCLRIDFGCAGYPAIMVAVI
uniref:Uncharacterized protein n=1 Tax=Cucumis melo TaxID=3656 RepID=A0A9I9ELA1_CUCME